MDECAVAGWNGWTRLEDGDTRNYRSPGGVIISNYEWGKKSAKYRGQGYIPENDLMPIGSRYREHVVIPCVYVRYIEEYDCYYIGQTSDLSGRYDLSKLGEIIYY